ncbi:hypothetical protein EX30DRAFT_342619 [Ascodesmis nigricans]|uniref:Uncharacterized protein n=1 Tax=Ascodesmis nigricans TaxID=341454 RepID=A0A4S2MPM7_9PEZI|nr:hypothetical protein EX30DRAFT_342619 [Ascodesmis nigricans]
MVTLLPRRAETWIPFSLGSLLTITAQMVCVDIHIDKFDQRHWCTRRRIDDQDL